LSHDGLSGLPEYLTDCLREYITNGRLSDPAFPVEAA
jgi:hypothetical protein